MYIALLSGCVVTDDVMANGRIVLYVYQNMSLNELDSEDQYETLSNYTLSINCRLVETSTAGWLRRQLQVGRDVNCRLVKTSTAGWSRQLQVGRDVNY